jgi:hypothetical protein
VQRCERDTLGVVKISSRPFRVKSRPACDDAAFGRWAFQLEPDAAMNDLRVGKYLVADPNIKLAPKSLPGVRFRDRRSSLLAGSSNAMSLRISPAGDESEIGQGRTI